MRDIDFFECSECAVVYQNMQNAKRHIEKKCKHASLVRVPMMYAVVGEEKDLISHLTEDATVFPRAVDNRHIINQIARAWGKDTARMMTHGPMMHQLSTVFNVTWGKHNTGTPTLQNVFRHAGKLVYARSEQTVFSKADPVDITTYPDTLETFMMLAYDLFVMHRLIVLDTATPGSMVSDGTTPSEWERYTHHALPNVPGCVMGCDVNAYADWMRPVVDMIRTGIPTYTARHEIGRTASDLRISVWQCPACGWSHPESTKTKRHISACRHATRTTDQPVVSPVKMNAVARRFRPTEGTRVAKRKRGVEVYEFTCTHLAACGDKRRVDWAFTSCHADTMRPDLTNDDAFLEAFVDSFHHLFGHAAVDPSFQSFYKKRGKVHGYVADYDDVLRAYTPLVKEFADVIDVLPYIIGTICLVWTKLHPSLVVDLVVARGKRIDGISFDLLEAMTDDDTHLRDTVYASPRWRNLLTRIEQSIPYQSEML